MNNIRPSITALLLRELVTNPSFLSAVHPPLEVLARHLCIAERSKEPAGNRVWPPLSFDAMMVVLCCLVAVCWPILWWRLRSICYGCQIRGDS